MLKTLYQRLLANALRPQPGTSYANLGNVYLVVAVSLVGISIAGLILGTNAPLQGMTWTVIFLIVVVTLALLSVVVFLMHEQYLANIRKKTQALEASQEKYRNVFDNYSLGIYETTVDGKIVDMNAAALAIIGVDANDIKTVNTVDQYVRPEQRKAFEEQMATNGIVRDFPVRLKKASGDEIECLISSTAIRDPNGHITGYQGIIRDVTAQYTAEQAIRHSEKKFRDFFEASPDPIFVETHDGMILDVNPAASRFHGCAADEMVGRQWTDFVPQEHVGKVRDNNQTFVRDDARYLESFARDFAGNTVPVGISASHIVFEGVPAILLHVRDISKRVEAEQELRRLSAHLEQAREDERKRISRDLHDDLGQDLTALKFEMSFLERKLLAQELERGILQAKTQSVISLVDGTLDKVRRISASLRPSVLDEMGLRSAMEWHSEDFSTRTQIRCELNINDIEVIDRNPEIGSGLFRIFQEALTNVARHSGAERVSIDLNCIDDEIVLEISDNGRGINANELHNSSSVGLASMKERAANLGGIIHIKGVEGKGTSISVTLPLTSE